MKSVFVSAEYVRGVRWGDGLGVGHTEYGLGFAAVSI